MPLSSNKHYTALNTFYRLTVTLDIYPKYKGYVSQTQEFLLEADIKSQKS